MSTYPAGTIIVHESSANCSSCGKRATMGDYAHSRAPRGGWQAESDPGCGVTFLYCAVGQCETPFEESRAAIQKQLPHLKFVHPVKVEPALDEIPPTEPKFLYGKGAREQLLRDLNTPSSNHDVKGMAAILKELIEQIDYTEALAEFNRKKARR